MTEMGIWWVLWLMAFALTSAAPKSHHRLLEKTKEQNDTLQVERDNHENILSRVRYFSQALEMIFHCSFFSLMQLVTHFITFINTFLTLSAQCLQIGNV